MKPGDVFTFDRGNFAGMEATVVAVHKKGLTVQLTIFGRKTEFDISADDLPDSDPRDHFASEIKQSFQRWNSHLKNRWWVGRARMGTDPDAEEWRAFLEFQKSKLAPLHAERDALLASFAAQFDDAALATEGPQSLHRRFKAEESRWLPYAQKWQAIIEERKRLMRSSPQSMPELSAEIEISRHRPDRAYYAYFREHHGLDEAESVARAEARRRQALEAALARYEEIKPRFHAAFGLILPEQTAHFWAFFSSLDELEREAADWVWRYPAGILDWYRDDFDDWTLLDGLDHRLHFRYRHAPPEFVCVMTGDSDGLNYGLWYDDPAEEPTWVASFYARDSAEVSPEGRTILEAYRRVLERSVAGCDTDPTMSDDDRRDRIARHNVLRDALCFFETADRPEVGESYDDVYGFIDLDGRVPTMDGFGVAATQPVDLPNRPDSAWEVFQIYKNDPTLVATWIDEARRQLASQNPYPALVIGRDLHAMDLDEFNAVALDLLVAAYEALGHHPLASIARIHHQHRDLSSVAVYRTHG